MNRQYHRNILDEDQDRFFTALEQLLTLEATTVGSALDQSTRVVAEALNATKVDALVHDPQSGALIIPGSSTKQEKERTLRLVQPLPADQEYLEDVFLTGTSFSSERGDGTVCDTGHRNNADSQDMETEIAAIIEVKGERCGVLVARRSGGPSFSERDLSFLEIAARWVGMVLHRMEKLEQLINETVEHRWHQAIEQFLMITVHELRNFLTPLKGHLSLLERHAQQDLDISSIALAKAALTRLERLTRGLTNMLYLEQGTFSITPQPLNVAELVRKVASTFQTEATKIAVKVPQETRICVDPTRLGQIVEFLLSYMVKHTPKHSPIEVDVNIEKRVAGMWMTVTVSNQGPINPVKLFPSHLLPAVADSGSVEAGLELYLAHSIAMAHGGTLTLDTLGGNGLCFSLALPIENDWEKFTLKACG